jgi:hypothetical protein
LSRLDRYAAAQRDPRGHRRVHRGGDPGDVGAVRQLDRAARAGERLVRHRVEHVVVSREVDELPVGPPPDAVDPRDHRQRAAARVVLSRGAAADARVQAGGEDIDEDLPAGRHGHLDSLVVRWFCERRDDGGVHQGHGLAPPEDLF